MLQNEGLERLALLKKITIFYKESSLNYLVKKIWVFLPLMVFRTEIQAN